CPRCPTVFHCQFPPRASKLTNAPDAPSPGRGCPDTLHLATGKVAPHRPARLDGRTERPASAMPLRGIASRRPAGGLRVCPTAPDLPQLPADLLRQLLLAGHVQLVAAGEDPAILLAQRVPD